MATTEFSPSGHHITTDPTTIAGDPFAWAGRRLEEARRGLCERRTEAELVEAVHEEEERRSYPMTYGERVAFARGFFAPEYEARHLDDLEDQLAHELLDDDERQELRDRVLRLRRHLSR
jgi:hypothetical protein